MRSFGSDGPGPRQRAWTEAARSLGVEPAHRRRPDPFHWLLYAFWLELPERYATWVLYDGTCSTWALRHVARLLTVAVLPVTAVIVFLPGPIGIRVLTAVVATSGSLLFTAVWVNESTDYRLSRAGWRDGIGPELRKRRTQMAEWMATVRRL